VRCEKRLQTYTASHYTVDKKITFLFAKMEAFKQSLKCTQCKGWLELPVLLPCGDSICQKHVTSESKECHCLECDSIHSVPSAGFPQNKALKKQLDARVQEANFCKEYTTAFESFKSLEETFEAMTLFKRDPSFFVNQAIGELKAEVDLLREEFKLKIDQKTEILIKELDEYELEYKSSLNSKPVSPKIDKILIESDVVVKNMEKWGKCLANFTPNENEWNLLIEECKTKKIELVDKLDECKQEALLNRLNDYQMKLVSFTTIELKSDRKYFRDSVTYQVTLYYFNDFTLNI
jgi:hypothetical protein